MDEANIVVFLGPSLSLTEARRILPNALYLPPVRCGDILRACRLHPQIIIIIDGFFESTAAAWHKEILYALKTGAHVYGAASMGALRAAELADFGMIGMGKIYKDYRNNVLTDDDEVCVLHRPKASNYESMSEAMVNIRASLLKAEKKGLIDTETRCQLIEIGRSLYYKARSLDAILKIAKREDLIGKIIFVDQKKQDAKEVLRRAATIRLKSLPRFIANFPLNISLYLKTLHFDVMCQPFLEDDRDLPLVERMAYYLQFFEKEFILTQHLARLFAASQALLIDEGFAKLQRECGVSLDDNCLLMRLFLDRAKKEMNFNAADYMRSMAILVGLSVEEAAEPHYAHCLEATMECWVMLEWAIHRLEVQVQPEGFQTYVDIFRRERGLMEADATYRWMRQWGLDAEQFEKLMYRLYCYDHFVVKNNFDQLGGAISLNLFWLYEAMMLTKPFVKINEIIKDPEQRRAVRLYLDGLN
ncbi:MAG: TfuA-like protein [Gammaproteobacteria bacterium]|nr:TfuA-like protein [Gammaproteobacteria bacterium]